MLWILLVATAAIVAVHLTLQYLNFVVHYQQVGQLYELANRFDLDDESSVPTWFAQVLFFAISLSAGLAAYLQTHKPSRRLWGIIAILGLILSLDEVAGLHEFVLQSLHNVFFRDASPTGLANAWWIAAPFILLASGWLVWKMTRLLPRRTMALMAAGGAIFLTGAVAVDLLTSLAPRETFLNQGVLVAVEEGLELVGSVIVLYAAIDYLEKHHYTVLKELISGLKARSRSKDKRW